jgi:hypothetical protein
VIYENMGEIRAWKILGRSEFKSILVASQRQSLNTNHYPLNLSFCNVVCRPYLARRGASKNRRHMHHLTTIYSHTALEIEMFPLNLSFF